jgi:hypothetical protein
MKRPAMDAARFGSIHPGGSSRSPRFADYIVPKRPSGTKPKPPKPSPITLEILHDAAIDTLPNATPQEQGELIADLIRKFAAAPL